MLTIKPVDPNQADPLSVFMEKNLCDFRKQRTEDR